MIETKKKQILWVCGILVGCVVILYLVIRQPLLESFSSKKKLSRDIIGRSKTIQRILARPIVPHPALPLRDHVHTWIVNVPLTPFKAPLILLPPVKKLPDFILYKPEYLTPVRNQGDCGSCWAFSVCDILSDRLMIQTGGLFNQNLSVQQLMSCFDRNGCDGGSPEDACMWLSKTQYPLITSREMPYREANGGYVLSKCPKKFKKKQHKVRVKEGSVKSLVEFISEEGYNKTILKKNIENMKRALVESGPFYCAMSVYDDLFSFSGIEVYKRKKGADLIGGHAIQVIGYSNKGVDKRPGFEDAYWICRNSWGKDWPIESIMSGYFTVEMGVNMCGIESRCGYAEPVLETSFTKDEFKGALSLEDIRYTNINDYLV